MAKGTVYVCSECGYESSKWNGRCPGCGEWNTLEETAALPVAAKKRSPSASGLKFYPLSEVDAAENEIRYKTGIGELDRVLGGGLVKGSLVLLGGEPGIGKSTLLLQICEYLGRDKTVLYVSGEESARQIKLRAERLRVFTENLYLLPSTDAEAVCATVVKEKPDIVIIDSIQTMSISAISSVQGSITQVRECANLFMRTAKSEEIPFIIVGHVNKDGAIAGPKVMEHIVDAVLYFEGQRNMSYRLLHAEKNRFGRATEIGVFEMTDRGLEEVENPSLTLLSGRPTDVSGCCAACCIEGSRPVMAEVQALAAKASGNIARRTSTGFDFNRLGIILAVLEKRLGLRFSSLDVYVSVVGGLHLDEPAADLSIALALYSSVTDKIVPSKLLAFGEIGLGGEVRTVSYVSQRLEEAERLGFEKCVVPKASLKGINRADFKSLKIVGVSSVRQALDEIQ